MVWPTTTNASGLWPSPPKYRILHIGQNERPLSADRGIFGTILRASSVLLKVLLLLAASLLLLTALSVLIPWLFQQQTMEHKGGQDLLLERLKQFREFQKKYSRVYGTMEERLQRFQVFVDNLNELEQRIRLQAERGEAGLTKWGVTQFFDRTNEELSRTLIQPPGLSPIEHVPVEPIVDYRPKAGFQRPKQFDWREKGVVTHVKNQLQCGSCWAFATVGVVETLHAIRNGTLISLSEQQMIDCDLTQNGCDGGFRPNAFRYVRDNGLVPDSEYPYRAEDRGQCRLPKGPIDPSKRVFVDDFKVLQSGEEQIADWIVEQGPVSFGMNATKSMYQYTGGIFSPTPEECAQQSLGGHAMEVVGFGESDQGVPYWIMKNSWGSGYGVNGGYLLMRRGVNACGLTREVYTALINK